MARLEHPRILMIMTAVSLAIVTTPMVGVLARTNLEEVASPASHAQRTFEKGLESWVSSQSHVAHPHPQHIGHQMKNHQVDKPLTKKADSDDHPAVVARWHRDNLHNTSRR